MGWWSEKPNGKELLIGDEPLDATAEMLRAIAQSYFAEVGRLPSVIELARTIEIVLASEADQLLVDGKGKEVENVVIKFRSQSKTRRVKPGDCFGVPLQSGGFGYGCVKDVWSPSLVLVDFLDVYSKSLRDLESITGANVLVEAVCGITSLTAGLWPIIGAQPVDIACCTAKGARERFEGYIMRHTTSRGADAARDWLEEMLIERHRRPTT